MDLLSSIRKTGSRGGVNFSWSDVSTSEHRENYLGHSLMAPVGRWSKGKDLSWYAKGDAEAIDGETAEEKRIRERKEEISKIKEAEEDALAVALGLPVKDRALTGANAITVGEMNRFIKESERGDEEIEEVGLQKGFSGGGTRNNVDVKNETIEGDAGALVPRLVGKKERRWERSGSIERRYRRHRRERSGERHERRSRSPERSPERRHRHRGDREGRRGRRRSPERKERRYRSRSPEGRKFERDDHDRRREGGRGHRRPRSRSSAPRDRPERRDRGRDYR